ncbi:hypothetical protein [Avibacterium paragallinarum]|uniref:Uncharacterized protein n=1 Tax=Avibacterium paragallinarum TaxID=728 RepID=A0A8B3TIR0_AVIPA|nr:hypothetical protein [Avibacterium paragallinarum]RZN60142.1 hypothetical protein EIG79_04310 [Avibacterium paragallinarum]
MRCRIAKIALLDAAIAHYLEKRPLLRFMSLFDDNEPYPLLEVVELLSERIRGQEAEFKKLPSEGLEWAIAKNKNQLAKLFKAYKDELTQWEAPQ